MMRIRDFRPNGGGGVVSEEVARVSGREGEITWERVDHLTEIRVDHLLDLAWPPDQSRANTLKDQSKKGLNTYDHWDLRLIRPERQINLERSLRPKLLRPVWPVTNISKFKDHSETKTLKVQYEKGWPLKYIGQVWRCRPHIGTL